ncbi:MAG: glycosyl hydrolase family 18 protein [Syntrophomonadaceae bacterium]|nr:glycosyl hydrolase family 18 protein [Syntrophomonadaceae bacterium]
MAKSGIKLLALLLMAALLAVAPGAETMAAPVTADEFKVVGYYSGSLFDEPVEKLPTDKLTHVIYAFLIPNADGSVKPLDKPEQLAAVTEQAHRDGAKVYIALGGWSYDGQPLAPVFEQVAADEGLRGALVRNVTAFVTDNGLDGAELDWEHPHAQTIGDYEKLATELSAALKAEGKALTGTVNGAWSATEGPEVSKVMTERCLDSFEFINVMGYDMNDADHSPLWFGETSIDYWLARGVAPEKIVLGMPLYARPSWLQYRDLVGLDAAYAYSDYAATQPLASHYNGLNTLRAKTLLALDKAGGVMLFDINEDVDPRDEALARYSVVNMIAAAIADYRPGPTPDDGAAAHEAADAADPAAVRLYIDGREVAFSATDGLGAPFIDAVAGRTMMPVRVCLNAIGCEVEWQSEAQTVLARKGDFAVAIPIGAYELRVNGTPRAIDAAAVIREGRTYLPLRSVFEAFGYAVDWDEATRTVTATELTPAAINGGTTGIFSRRQLHFSGYGGIEGDITLPLVTIAEQGDCPYVYFGFDWPDDAANAEGGFQFIEDPAHPAYNSWTVFLRQGDEWRWGDNIALAQGSTHHLKFYCQPAAEGQMDLVIELDGREVVRKASQPADFSLTAAKAVIAMAMSKPFDGANCFSRSEHAGLSNLRVCTIDSGLYTDFGAHALYHEWRPEVGQGGIWYGSADCLPAYLHYAADGKVSIFAP